MLVEFGVKSFYSCATAVSFCSGPELRLCTCRRELEDLINALEQAVQV